ncbi:uncharacterized protein LTR77_009085 [Saxophila tyrrhenica]|uniref:Kinesin motor domain-containing protein n=1 Tax=Saxophila tyrrhenica TaxID=1690608 RepID=A0AAV9P2E6_9PEZI|nr:hypothetical protein LTR77_009085 [Saxophila tyrrhenica]
MDMSPSAPTSPPTTPYRHNKQPSTASLVMQRAKRSSSRVTDGVMSRSSDDDGNRTAVKVAVRVRPPLKPTDPGYDLIPQRFREATCEAPTPTSLSVQSPHGKKLFVFDRVFDEATTQDGVWEYLSDSVSSFVKGYNVSILAYGQSGSGKSYTMGTSGPEDQDSPQIKGIVPRAAQKLFEKLVGAPHRQSALQAPKRYSMQALPTMASFSKAGSGEKNWTLKATYVEIYQEQLRDLLVDETIPQQDRAQVQIREDPKGRIMVTGLTQININSVEDLLNALNFGSSIRQTDATNINARSSRSHAVFSLNLVQKKPDGSMTPKQEKRASTPIDGMSGADNMVTLDSKLHFVDLAGSERLKNTGATGDRAKEGISINAGLASLGKVIAQLSSKGPNAHISYRDSRLTRLLQDSLGGNAITFMVACVTPAVFHLSETLNTVHYAQRARAIQSKPEIQQSHEEGDKQAAIDRLRAEVSFLRDQIRHSEHSDNKSADSRGRSDKIRSKEADLESQLMDMQENYNALSGRHAKLISELSKARDGETTDTPLLNEAVGANASERIQRSNSFAQAVEQMVLEYEKTIQTLEGSLSKTRSSLSNSESTLLEKETRIAYMETIQHQLQARIQKALDREQSNESYLEDLESKIEGTTSGEEKNAAVIVELRKELARVRESENSAEEYISTLEERLAEAEHDQDVMQRELERLEHVVERQRSIGRLDNLLGELDTIRNGEDDGSHHRGTNGDGPLMNGHRESYDPYRPQSQAYSSTENTRDDYFEDAEAEQAESEYPEEEFHDSTATRDMMEQSTPLAKAHRATQSDFMADKFENMTQELFDLRSEHENVMSDYDKLQQKYRTALETLAKLEYDKEMRKQSKDTPFLAGAGMKGEEKAEADGQPSSSRSASPELSSQHQSTSSLDDLIEKADSAGSEPEQAETLPEIAEKDAVATQVPLPVPSIQEPAHPEVELLRRLNSEQEVNAAQLTKTYKALHARHEATLLQVEELKQEVAKSRDNRPSSPSYSPSYAKPYFSRRKSDDVMGSASDRASRSITSLKTIANHNLEENVDARQSFDLNLNTVMSELSNRSERVQALEAELSTVRKEMETKQTIIAGLTRERGSLKASLGVDFSVVQQMREQLLESENQIRLLQEQHMAKEKEFESQVDSLKATLATQARQLPIPGDHSPSRMPGGFEETPARELSDDQAMGGAREAEQVARLQSQLDAWELKHHETVASMKTSEAQLLETIAQLEESVRNVEDRGTNRDTPVEASDAGAAATAMLEKERAKHQEVVDALQREIEEHRSTSNNHVQQLQELETAYSKISQQVEDDSNSRDLSSQELQTHKNLIANLENQLQVHKSTITIHQESLESLQSSHSKEIEELKVARDDSEKQATERYAALETQHRDTADNLQSELTKAQSEKTELLRSASSALGYQTDASTLHSQIKGLVEEGKEIHARHLKTTNELKAVQEELQNAINKTVDLENKIAELKSINEETITSLEKMTEKEKKSSRLVDELEEQLNNTFDSHQATNNRLSTMQGEVAQQRIEIERELESQKLRNQILEQQVEAYKRASVQSEAAVNFNRESLSPEAAAIALARSGSASSNARKSLPSALPTPPPSIPLPPLPGSPTSGANPIPNGIDGRATSPPPQRTTSPIPNNTSPPGSRHASRDINHRGSQQVEEQEARIRTIEKHLFAEKQLTATLEEALVDLETSANRTKAEAEQWRRKANGFEDELKNLQREKTNSRASLQAVEEEREMRVRAERARQALEQRMEQLNSSKKKKKNSLNCF